jgi:dTDP-4-dehydrorhamnose reductase
LRVETDLNRPEMRRLFAAQPEKFQGFTEWDEPNFSFRHAPCNFYSGTKALAEEAIRGVGQNYIWRPRMLFNECNEPRNLLAKLQYYERVYDNVNSISHLDEFVRACLELWERQAPFGIYNVVNPGAVTTRSIIEMIQQFIAPNRHFDYWQDDEEFYRCQAKTPRSNCILDSTKLLSLGVKLRPVKKALEDTLERWHAAEPVANFGSRGFVERPAHLGN